MKVTGGCYCGDIRYEVEGEPILAGQCHCRQCQYITGGGPNFFLGMPRAGMKYVQGETTSFTRTDIENAVTRLFCSRCGTSIGTEVVQHPDAIYLKVGCFDEPDLYKPQVAIFTGEAQSFHAVPEDLPTFEGRPVQ